MQYRRPGRSGLEVSSLCLGAMTFGEADDQSFMHKVSCDEATSHAIIDRALDAGVNFVDTADVYGQDGLSERVIGSWFTAGGRRDASPTTCPPGRRRSSGSPPSSSGASRGSASNSLARRPGTMTAPGPASRPGWGEEEEEATPAAGAAARPRHRPGVQLLQQHDRRGERGAAEQEGEVAP